MTDADLKHGALIDERCPFCKHDQLRAKWINGIPTIFCAKHSCKRFIRNARITHPADDDPVNHPAHYTSHPSGIECIKITQHMNFCRGSAVKYIWRAGLKGDAIEDLEKAVWYLKREIARLRAIEPDA